LRIGSQQSAIRGLPRQGLIGLEPYQRASDGGAARTPGKNPPERVKRSAPAHNTRVNRTLLLWLVLFGLLLVTPLVIFAITTSWRTAWTAWWRSMVILAACATLGLMVGLMRGAG
jgi:hypothetical protein